MLRVKIIYIGIYFDAKCIMETDRILLVIVFLFKIVEKKYIRKQHFLKLIHVSD